MKRRLISALLSAVILVSMIPALAVSADDVVQLKTSEKAIALLKEIEGFSRKAYYDHGHYSIGYGTSCTKNQYPNGITKAEADILMRESMAKMEVYLDKFIAKYALDLSSTQYDALMMFTYNLGSGWTTTDSDFRTAVINGCTGNEFIYYISRWCTASGEISTGLVERRLAEADLYLYGYYAVEAPDNYSYVIFDGNGGTSTSTVQGYDACDPTPVRAAAEYTGHRFMGWYTESEGGQWISHLDASTKGITLYAHWQKDDGSLDEFGNILGTDVRYTRITSTALKAYDAPAADAEEMEDVPAQTTVTILADYVDKNGVKWGMLEDYSWIDLTETTVTLESDPEPVRPAVEEEEEEENEEESSDEDLSVQVTVTGTNVNYRSGPGTSYTKLGTMNTGKQLMITETAEAGGMKWGKFSYGWICLAYTNYDAVIASKNEEGSDETVIATGTVVNCNSLRIRSGAGTNYDVAGTLACGSKVNIYQIVTNGSMQWGRIASGWISLNYVTLSYTQDPPSDEDDSQEESPAEEPSDGSITGTVIADRLNVRSGAGTNYSVVATLVNGTSVTITQQKTVSGVAWGKISQGWICMQYVRTSSSPAENEDDTQPDPPSEDDSTDVITGTVTATHLRVRKGAGTNYDVVDTLTKGTTVTVTEQKLVGGLAWGRIESGWVCMSYIKISSGSTDVECTGTVTASALTIRSAAGTGNAVVGRYVKGTVVTIMEITSVGSTLWGRTDKGWICMDYVSY